MLRRRPAFTLIEILVALAIIVSLVVFLLPMRRGTREAARRIQCQNNIKQIMLAILAYEVEQGKLPPAYTVDNEGNRLHSWRTLILPYLEEQELYDSIDLSKPWDDPVNAKARSAYVEVFLCPSSNLDDNMSNYLVVVGPDLAFSGHEQKSLADILDGTQTTLGVIDASEEDAVEWMSPYDLSEEKIMTYHAETRTNHAMILVGFFDGHVEHLDREEFQEQVPAILTIAGSEELSSLQK